MSARDVQRLLVVVALAAPLAFARPAGAVQPDAPPPPYQPPPPSQFQPPPPDSQPPYPQPPYPYPPPPASYLQPPYPYPPPPPYAPQPGTRPYQDGDPVPAGYHVEDRPRNGLVVGGWTLLLVPYGISALSAIGTRGDNGTNWLFAPVVGPWLVLGDRSYSGCGQPNSDTGQSLGCVADFFAVIGLVVDGLLQAAGATLLLVGYLNPRHVVVRDEPAWRILPVHVGSGEGAGLRLTF